MEQQQFCHICGGRGDRHRDEAHQALEDATLNRLAERVSAIRAEIAGQPASPHTHRFKLSLYDGSGAERSTREVLFFRWPGDSDWFTQPLFAVTYGDGAINHLRALRAGGDEVAPTIDLPLEVGIRPYRDAEPRLLGWAAGASGWGTKGFPITAVPEDADANFWDRPSSGRDRIESVYTRLFTAESEYAERRDELAPLLQARGEHFAARDYPLSTRSNKTDLHARELYLRAELAERGHSNTWPEVATQGDLWEAAKRAGIIGVHEMSQAYRMAPEQWSHGGD